MSAKYAITDLLPLPNSAVRIPRLGFGVYQSAADVCTQSCLTALSVGYRHIDSAQFYANEAQVGEAVRQSKVPRDSVFVTTKILSPKGSVEKSYQKIVESVDKINLDGYVDLFLIHSPSSGPDGRKELWLALEKAHAEGRVRSIGVSNFGVGHIEEMKSYAKIWPPHVNQIEVCICFRPATVAEIVFQTGADGKEMMSLASSLVPATDDRCVLSQARHCR